MRKTTQDTLRFRFRPIPFFLQAPGQNPPLADLPALQDWIDAGARGTFVADCRITSSVRAPWLSEWMEASRAAKAAVAG